MVDERPILAVEVIRKEAFSILSAIQSRPTPKVVWPPGELRYAPDLPNLLNWAGVPSPDGGAHG